MQQLALQGLFVAHAIRVYNTKQPCAVGSATVRGQSRISAPTLFRLVLYIQIYLIDTI